MKIEIVFSVIFYFTLLNYSKCSDSDFSYPEDKIDALDLWKYNQMFNSRPAEDESGVMRKGRSLNERNNFNLQDYLVETKLCDSQIVFTRPQKLKNSNNKMLAIVNHRNYTQFVRFENCLEPSFPCTRNIYPFDTKSFCHQNYHTIKLLAFDQENNCLLEDNFVVPSTCDCMIDKDDLFRGVHKNILRGD